MSEEVVQERPEQYSPEWTDYVLSQLTEQEKRDGKPTAPGLKRAFNSLFPDVYVNEKQNVHHVGPEYAAVTISLDIGTLISIVGSAECSEANTDPPYNKYPLATAQTRALGRAYKRLLGIDIITAEESSRKASISDPALNGDEDEGSISNTQIKFIELMATKINVNVGTVIKRLFKESRPVKRLSHSDAILINEHLDELSKDLPKIEADEELKGYDKNWLIVEA